METEHKFCTGKTMKTGLVECMKALGKSGSSPCLTLIWSCEAMCFTECGTLSFGTGLVDCLVHAKAKAPPACTAALTAFN